MTAGLRADVSLRLGPLDLAARLDVAAGETVAVLGPNGAGKTTLLAALAGLVGLDAGNVVLDGHVLEDTATGRFVPPERRPIAVVFQDRLLFPHLSALDNVAFGLRCRGTRRRQSRQRALAWLERMGLADHAGARPAQLSGGQAQLVALARALVTEPRLVLLDEPLSALDATVRAATRRDLRRHLADYGGVRIIVTHDPVEAAALADRLVVLEAGRVVQDGSPAEVRAHPRSRYVADLVGVNLLRGRGHQERVAVSSGGSLIVANPVEGDVLAVIHPRAIALHRTVPEGSSRNVWEGHVTALDRESERVRVQIGGQLPVVAEVTRRAVEELGLAEGDHIWVSLKATEIEVFPA